MGKHDYCPYKSPKEQPEQDTKALSKLPDSGLVVLSGKQFTIALRSKIKAMGIKIRKSGMYVCINGKIKPVWEKENWDMCSLIGELFHYTGIECELDDYIVDEIEDMGKLF